MIKLIQQVFTLLCVNSLYIQSIACSTIINTTTQETLRYSLNPIVFKQEGKLLSLNNRSRHQSPCHFHKMNSIPYLLSTFLSLLFFLL